MFKKIGRFEEWDKDIISPYLGEKCDFIRYEEGFDGTPGKGSRPFHVWGYDLGGICDVVFVKGTAANSRFLPVSE